MINMINMINIIKSKTYKIIHFIKHYHHTRQSILLTLTCFFLTIGFLWFFYWLIWDRFFVFTDDAYVNGNIIQLMPQISGTVVGVYTDNTQLVVQKQSLVKLNVVDQAIALQQAKANLAITIRQVRQYFANAQQAYQSLMVRKENLLKSKQDLDRRANLVAKHVISKEELQHYKIQWDNAKAQYQAGFQQLESALALIQNAHLYSHPLVERAKANLKKAYVNLQRTTILSPATGIVAKRTVQVGDQVNPTTPLLVIIPLYNVWVEANYKESQLSRIRIGQPVILSADAYPGVVYHGKVVGWTPGTGNVFALIPPQNATGNWIKIVQRLPIRISLDPKELNDHPLPLGLSMRVTINTHNLQRPMLPQTVTLDSVETTSAYIDELKGAETLINSILRANSPDLFLPFMPSIEAGKAT